ncbi:MAG: dienelactone hydrolase family protein [Pseudomonadota bacterium]|jgi:carboxymethylenebutenolidase
MVHKTQVNVPAPDGVMPAHWLLPEGAGPFPAVVVLMEAFGLVRHIEEVAERLAGEGYAVLAPDLYYRQLPDNRVGYDEVPRAVELMQSLDDRDFIADLRAALAFLRDSGRVDATRIGITGFCMGGRLAFLAACALPGEIAAAAPFYGGGIPRHLEQAEAIRCPLLLFFGDRDPLIGADQVQAIEERLRALGKDYRIQRYADAGHGFFCDHRSSYHAPSAADAWTRLTGFLAGHLRGR